MKIGKIPIGYCQCGCGARTGKTRQTDVKRGYKKGDPLRFLPNHFPLPRSTPKPILQRIEKKIHRGNNSDDCWLYGDSPCKAIYPVIKLNAKNVRVHRVMYELTYGPIPDGYDVLHKCDVPRCCNPSHLFLGKDADNIRDCISKGRANRTRGEEHYRAKLTESIVKEIRARYTGCRGEQSAFAREYGVSTGTIRFIVMGITWKHVSS